MNEGLEKFLHSLIKRAHHPAELPDVLLRKMVQDLYIQLEQQLEDVILDHLPEEHHIAYYQLLRTGGTQQEVMELVEMHVPDIYEKAATAIKQFEADYLHWTAQMA